MRKISKPLPDLKQIEINEIVFDVLKADLDIMEKATILVDKYSDLKETDLKEIVDGVKECVAYIDEILGQGATAKITQGRPLGLNYAVDLMQDICVAVIEEYNQKIADEYE